MFYILSHSRRYEHLLWLPSVFNSFVPGIGRKTQTWGFDMKLTKWSYAKRYNIKAQFNEYPNSTVVFRKIKNYYFVYTVKWSLNDPIVSKEALEEMEWLLNRELETLQAYRLRKHLKNEVDK
jgi:hypothetical protein